MYVIIRSFFNPTNKTVKTKLLRILLILVLLLISAIVFYGSFVEPQLIKEKQLDLSLGKTEKKENIKLVFVSDLHLGPYKQADFFRNVIDKIKKVSPDLVVFGGDFISDKEKEALLIPKNELKELAQSIPTFAVMGNHEYHSRKYGDPKKIDKTKTLREILAECNVQVLNNDVKNIKINNDEFVLSGIDDLWSGNSNLQLVVDQIDPKQPNVLISHNPDVLLDANHQFFDLILSGHTHAGQIRLPLIGSILGVPTILGREYDHGLFKFDKNLLYISAGVGESGTRARLFNPPEITVINLDL